MLCVSCSTTHALRGNIHVYDANHNEIKTYNNIIINDNMFKSHGLNFFDSESGSYVYLSQSTIYSITYGSMHIADESSTIEIPESDKDYLSYVDKLILYRYQLMERLNNHKNQIKSIDKTDSEYITIQNNIANLRRKIKNIEDTLWEYDVIFQ